MYVANNNEPQGRGCHNCYRLILIYISHQAIPNGSGLLSFHKMYINLWLPVVESFSNALMVVDFQRLKWEPANAGNRIWMVKEKTVKEAPNGNPKMD